MIFAERLKEAMALRKMKPVVLSRKTGLCKGTISRYLHGYYAPKYAKTKLIADALDVNVEWLSGNENVLMNGELKPKDTNRDLLEAAYEIYETIKDLDLNDRTCVIDIAKSLSLNH